jgi:hypothetical protein
MDWYLLYRHFRAVTLTPAKAAGNLAVVLAIFTIWLPIKLYRMQAWHIFSWAFILGTPLVGLALVAILLARYRRDMRAFLDSMQMPSPSMPPAPSASTDPGQVQGS